MSYVTINKHNLHLPGIFVFRKLQSDRVARGRERERDREREREREREFIYILFFYVKALPHWLHGMVSPQCVFYNS